MREWNAKALGRQRGSEEKGGRTGGRNLNAEIEAAREHIEAGKDEGRRLVVEAKTFRERILRDLAGRRKLARKQLESMRAAQERLLGAFTACAVAVESATGELHTALPEAKMAADDAAKRVTDDIEDVVVAMEAAMLAPAASL